MQKNLPDLSRFYFYSSFSRREVVRFATKMLISHKTIMGTKSIS